MMDPDTLKITFLLVDPSPCLRWLVLRQLLGLPEGHAEVQELAAQREKDPLVTGLLRMQQPDGAWQAGPESYGSTNSSRILVTGFALARLGYLGFDQSHPAVAAAGEYLFSQQQADGSWPLHPDYLEDEEDAPRSGRERYSMMPMQTAFPLRGLAACGFAADPRAEKAYEWLLAQRLADGAWPTGMAYGVNGYVAGYRRLPHSRWGCRSNTTSALLCLGLHPQRRYSPEARRGLDLLLGRETRERHVMGCEVARLLGAEPAHGFITFFARFDLALILSLCAQVGATLDDLRVASLVEFILQVRGQFGLWEYSPAPQVARWVTFDLLRSLSALTQDSGWLSQEPRTPFQPYLKRGKRF